MMHSPCRYDAVLREEACGREGLYAMAGSADMQKGQL